MRANPALLRGAGVLVLAAVLAPAAFAGGARLPLIAPRSPWRPPAFAAGEAAAQGRDLVPRAAGAHQVSPEDGWSGRFLSPGADSTVYAMAVQGDSVVVAGDFNALGTRALQSIALFDGTQWNSLGGGFPGSVRAVTWWKGLLVVGGSFTQSGGAPGDYVAVWDGAGWQPLGVQVDGPVQALAVHAGALAVGGAFLRAGADSVRGVGLWDGQVWRDLDRGVTGGEATVYALLSDATGLYVGGRFDRAGADTVNNVAVWTNGSWNSLSSGMLSSGARSPYVYALAAHLGSVIAGGYFAISGGVQAYNLSGWDGLQWSPVGGAAFGLRVRALTSDGTRLFAGGTFTTIGGVSGSTNNIAVWDGVSWAALRAGLYNHEGYGVWSGDIAYALATYRGALYVGGHFTLADSLAAPFLARWDGVAWAAVVDGAGVSFDAMCFLPRGDSLIVGGQFFSAGPLRTGYIGSWDGGAWHALGAGFSADVYALVAYHGDLIAGGAFTRADGRVVNGIARWDGGAWQPVGSGVSPGMNSWVVALHVWHDTLLVGGFFTTVEGQPVRSLATWDGTRWGEFQGGADQWVNALGEWNGRLVVGGGFTEIGGQAASLIATWDGVRWDNLGGGLTSYAGYFAPRVYATAVYQDELVVGGDFDVSDTFGDMRRLASWDGTRWRELGLNGLDAPYGTRPPAIMTLLVDGPYLTAAGCITRFGQTTANYIARWDGAVWRGLGSGLAFFYPEQGAVWALARWRDSLYVGGDMVRAGGHKSDYWAQWDESDLGATAVDGGPGPGPAPAGVVPPGLRTRRRPAGVDFAFPRGAGREVRLRVLDVRGRTVRVVTPAPGAAATGHALWDGRQSDGRPAAAGVYRGVLAVDGRAVAAASFVWLP